MVVGLPWCLGLRPVGHFRLEPHWERIARRLHGAPA